MWASSEPLPAQNRPFSGKWGEVTGLRMPNYATRFMTNLPIEEIANGPMDSFICRQSNVSYSGLELKDTYWVSKD